MARDVRHAGTTFCPAVARFMRRVAGPVVFASWFSSAGCSGIQSALDPAGREAERIARLYWWMVAGAVVIWLAVMGLALYFGRPRQKSLSRRRANWIIIGGGAIVPTVVLAVLLIFGLSMLPALVAPAPAGSLQVAVSGELWWWRVRYQTPGGEPIELANEIHLPVGEPVEFRLESQNVIHSFWIPSLGGKMDMIPGRVTRLALLPTRTGVFRGVCAEYCGTSHTLMQFDVVVEEKEDFNRWLSRQAQPAGLPAEPVALRGQQHFLMNGCGACHAIRGTRAVGVIGPDLTHVGSRRNLAAGTLPGETADFRRWISRTAEVKPGAHMPKFDMLPPEVLDELALYLEVLK